MTLFDPDPFTKGTPKRPRRRSQLDVITTTTAGEWHVIATTAGPVRFVHVLDSHQPAHLVIVGSVLTCCDVIGRVVERVGAGVDVHPCPTCRLRVSQ